MYENNMHNTYDNDNAYNESESEIAYCITILC